ncbi:amino acid adenylation domain-containing protein [Actinosynnema sp. CS-041913]|uniref:amino acid adenylation domain-containing protein n=1 Tax=Actinosynnema sp. CS-041913 TaxID=3239917 RepID=UPI003D90A544
MESPEPSRAEHLDRVRTWNRTATDYPRDGLVHELFAAQAQATPDAVALSPQDGEDLTYGEVLRRMENLAAVLAAEGVRVGDSVAVAIERSVDAYVAILAILRTGARWVPIGPDDPQPRVETVLADAGCGVVVVPPTGNDALPSDVLVLGVRDTVDAEPPQRPELTARHPAYVMYTSGSTGAPKGVVVPHRGIVRLARNTGVLAFRPDDTVCATVNPTFDMSVFELFGALLNGARLAIPTRETVLSAPALESFLAQQRVTTMWLGSALFHQFVAQRPEMFRGLRRLVAGGDALNPNVVRKLLATARPGRLVDGYGPTENTGLSTAHVVEELPPEAESVPIGRPVCDSTAYVVREDGSLADVGEEGELWVGGDGVAIGYLNKPRLTAQRFVPDQFSDRRGGVLYRTGDMARWRRDGVLEFLGRRDRQVKIDGFRVELREIEIVLAAHHQVEEAVVAVLDGPAGARHLCGWVTGAGGADRRALPEALRRHLRDRLPMFMVPTELRVVDAMPLTSSGKVDRDRLRTTGESEQAPVDERDRPREGAERLVASVWQRALGVPAVRRQDDFFALGGQSVQAAQVAAAVGGQAGVAPHRTGSLVRALLTDPSLERFARQVDAVRSAADESAATAVDFSQEARLSEELRFSAPPAGDPAAPRRVLLTGASGFLGVFLLDRLVDAGVPEVHCLVRAHDEAHARRRLAGRVRRYGLDYDKVADHVVPLVGDLSEPRLGLEEDGFDRLAGTVDTIVHNGAAVNFAYPYEALRGSNVDSVRTLLELAASPRLKTFHHISTIAVLTGFAATGSRYVMEDEPPGFPERLSLGYLETKWVAEQLVRDAARRGLPVSIHRPSEITGTRDRGIWNTDTFLCAWFRAIVETGTAPDVELPLDFVPVDYTAETIVHIIRTQRHDGRTYHLANPHAARLDLLVDRLRHRGYRISKVPYADWVDHVTNLSRTDPYRPMTPYLPMFNTRVTGTSTTVEEMQLAGNFPQFSRANTARATGEAGPHPPPVDADLLDKYLDRLIKSGFLPPAPGRDATRPLPADDTGTPGGAGTAALVRRMLPDLTAHVGASPLGRSACHDHLGSEELRRVAVGEVHTRRAEAEAFTRLAHRFRGTPAGGLFDRLSEAVTDLVLGARAAAEALDGAPREPAPAAVGLAAFFTGLAADAGPGAAAAAVRSGLLMHSAVCAELGHALRRVTTLAPTPVLRYLDDSRQVLAASFEACGQVIARAIEEDEEPDTIAGTADRVAPLLHAYWAAALTGRAEESHH